MTPGEFLAAARVPETLAPQTFGLWRIERHHLASIPGLLPTARHALFAEIGAQSFTALRRVTLLQMHLTNHGEVVMEDTVRELRRHLPIWLAARGRILITGLGLGCVVRGLLASPRVELIDVVELDRDVLRVVGAEFERDPRVRLHLGDALTFGRRTSETWDFAWHDLWREPIDEPDGGLQLLHAHLIATYRHRVRQRQGAWMFPRLVKRRWPDPLLGARRRGAP